MLFKGSEPAGFKPSLTDQAGVHTWVFHPLAVDAHGHLTHGRPAARDNEDPLVEKGMRGEWVDCSARGARLAAPDGHGSPQPPGVHYE